MILRSRQDGFSLIELIVVMSIITVLAGAAVPVLTKSLTRARVQDTRAELASLQGAILAYFEDTGSFPPSFEDLERNKAEKKGWVGPYLRASGATAVGKNLSLARDAWDQKYLSEVKDGVELTITSRGADGVKKTADDLSVVIEVTPILRRITREELALLNAAVLSYNRDRLPDHPLPSKIKDLLKTLQAGGYLPSGTHRFDADAWGASYRPDPAGKQPVVSLTSKHLSPSS